LTIYELKGIKIGFTVSARGASKIWSHKNKTKLGNRFEFWHAGWYHSCRISWESVQGVQSSDTVPLFCHSPQEKLVALTTV